MDDFYISAGSDHIKKERQKARELRKSQWWRQRLAQGVCYYCEEKFSPTDLTMDHVIPVSRGGKSSKGNVVVACKQCNTEKKHRTPVERLLDEEKRK
ncbi:MAG: HNH endonuclease [Bdellovibrionales bacterium]|nr:HNH endonuclease [Bdellovibrionales bacterium]